MFSFVLVSCVSKDCIVSASSYRDGSIGGRTRGAGVAAAPLLGSIFLTGFLF